MEKSNETKRQIIDATKKIVKVRTNVTVKDICSAAYVNAAAINYHFGDKRNLMNIVLKEIIDEFKEMFIKEIDTLENYSLEQIMEHIIELVYQFSLENQGMIRYLFSSDESGLSSENIGILQNFLFKDAFFSTVMAKLIAVTKDTNTNVIYAKYMILFSSLCLPMIVEFTSSDNNRVLSKELMNEYIHLLAKVLMA
ncbi:MAG: TetR/AcrR family transcriptional regulator [Bacilli bacterium]|nr:TetR/AcrR family transcriptional regulator [Bacilli bacterium]